MNRSFLRSGAILRPLQRASPPLRATITSKMDYSSVPTPERCYADFCLVPVSAPINQAT